jgi:hypothetical protein
VTDLVRDALLAARGFIGGYTKTRMGAGLPVRSEQLEILTNLDRAIGSLTPAELGHDAGACARCSFCRRYTADIRALSQRPGLLCDCGQAHGWSGSFERPGVGAEWSLSLREAIT